MEEDYFVLHRIGCIYLYVEKHFDLELARQYFIRAAKYAIIESDPSTTRLANILITDNSPNYLLVSSDYEAINLLSADSYEKAAFASYVIGDIENAVKYQNKAAALNNCVKNRYQLSKYLARNGKSTEAALLLNLCIDESPEIFDLLVEFREIDLSFDVEIQKLLIRKNREINKKLLNIYSELGGSSNKLTDEIKIDDLIVKPYSFKLSYHRRIERSVDIKYIEKIKELNELIKILKFGVFKTLTFDNIQNFVSKLKKVENKEIEEIEKTYKEVYDIVKHDRKG
jgi:tetratricopeptide (TPR) repeat protein